MRNGKRKYVRTDVLKKRWPVILYTVLFLGILALSTLYFRLTSTPLPSYEIGPSGNMERWRFSLKDGTVLEPADGKLPLTGSDTVVICQTRLTEDLSNHPLFSVTANYADCAVYVNDRLVYAPSGRFDGEQFETSGYEASAASGQFVALVKRDGDVLTMCVQFQGEDNLIRHLPRLTVYYDTLYYRSQSMASTADAAVPAGMFLALALFLAALFFIGAWKDKLDTGLLFLTVCALSMALTSTTPYTTAIVWTLHWASVSTFCSMLPLLSMSWALWYRLSRRLRMILLPVIGLVTLVLVYYLIAGFGRSNMLNKQINILQIWVVPGAVLLTLIVAAMDAAKGNPWFRRFFRYLAWSVPVVALGWSFSALTGGKLARTMTMTFRQVIDYQSLFRPCEQLCLLMLILMFIQALLDLISGLARRDTELQALSMREKYAVENMKLMMETQQSTRQEHHEMRHHIALIAEMLSSGQQERAQTYAHSLLDRVNALPSDSYSANPVINAIVGRYLNEARAAGIDTSADIRDKEKVVLQDDELCVLLTNMLENALEACLKLPAESARFLHFRLLASEEHLVVGCENSMDRTLAIDPDGSIATSKEEPERHGFGLHIMRQIIENHNGQFSIFCAEGVFSVKAVM